MLSILFATLLTYFMWLVGGPVAFLLGPCCALVLLHSSLCLCCILFYNTTSLSIFWLDLFLPSPGLWRPVCSGPLLFFGFPLVLGPGSLPCWLRPGLLGCRFFCSGVGALLWLLLGSLLVWSSWGPLACGSSRFWGFWLVLPLLLLGLALIRWFILFFSSVFSVAVVDVLLSEV